MANICEQRTAFKFCFSLDRKAANVVDMLYATYKEHA